jgi:hypothetical protein
MARPGLWFGGRPRRRAPEAHAGSFRRCFCSPNPSASTSASSIQMHYEPFCSCPKVRELWAMTAYNAPRQPKR